MKILISGSVAYDYLMTFPGYFREHILPDHLESISLSFLVDSMVRQRGGIAPNIAYTQALLGQHPAIWATVGEDFGDYREWLEKIGVDTSYAKLVPGIFTASYFCNTDRSNAQIASFYPGAMAFAAQLNLSEIKDRLPDLVVISPSDPAAMIKLVEECRELGQAYLYDPSQQIVRLSETELLRGIEAAQSLFVNDYEYALIQKKTGLTEEQIHSLVKFMVVTRGEQGASIFVDGREILIPVVPADPVVDPTGVGDAFRGGFLTGLAYGLDLVTCGQMGSLAATYCLEHSGSQGYSFTREQFVTRFRLHFDDQGRLDILFQEKGITEKR